MAVLLALLAATSYGVSDFAGGLVSRRTSAWSVAVIGAAGSTLTTGMGAVLVPGHWTAADLAWAAAGGAGAGIGVGFLYRGFAAGRMSVVGPVSGVGAAVLPVLFGLVAGERPSVWVWAGIAFAVPAIGLVSSSPSTGADPGRAGLADAVLAGLGFGLLFACLGQVPRGAGLLPTTVANAVSLVAAALMATLLGASWLPRDPVAWWGVLAGPFGGAGSVLFLLATQHGYLTVASVLTSLYPAATVLLALVVLREPVHRRQALGLLLCAVTVALVAGG